MILADVAVYSVLAGGATLLGTLGVLRFEAPVRRNSVLIISFASGVMLAISFLHLIPEALEMTPVALEMVFAGFLGFYLLQQLIALHPCHDKNCETHLQGAGTLSAVGLLIHSLMDGIAIAAGFEADWTLGLLTTLAVLLHEVPEGITITGILLHYKTERPKVLGYSAAVALATPLGAVGSFFLLRDISPAFIGALLALIAGSFIYLAASDLLPETHRVRHRAGSVFFLGGVALILIVGHLAH